MSTEQQHHNITLQRTNLIHFSTTSCYHTLHLLLHLIDLSPPHPSSSLATEIPLLAYVLTNCPVYYTTSEPSEWEANGEGKV